MKNLEFFFLRRTTPLRKFSAQLIRESKSSRKIVKQLIRENKSL